MLFGDILKELLEERGIIQKDLATHLNMATSTLGNYIRNQREPDYETLKQIAAYFEVSLDYLLDYKSTGGKDYREDHLLEIFRSMNEEHKAIFLEQGKVFLRAEHVLVDVDEAVACADLFAGEEAPLPEEVEV